MVLTTHQQHHVLQLLIDATDMPTGLERVQVAQDATDLLNGTMPWPDVDLREDEIHDWVEDLSVFRIEIQSELDSRRIARGG